MYKHEITAFLGNAAAAVQYDAERGRDCSTPVKILRTTSPLNPESLASFDQRLTTNRANPYFKPLGYNQARERPGELRQHALRRRDHGHAAAPRPGGRRPQLPAPHLSRPLQPRLRRPRQPLRPDQVVRAWPAGDPRRVEPQHRAGPAVRQAGRFQVDRQVPGVHPLPARAAPAVGLRARTALVSRRAARLAPFQARRALERSRVDPTRRDGESCAVGAFRIAHDKEEIDTCELGDVSRYFWLGRGSRGGLDRLPGERRRRAAAGADLYLPGHRGQRFLREARGPPGSPRRLGGRSRTVKLGVRVRSQFNPSTSETTSVNLQFDNDIELNLAAVPGTCTAAS